MCPTIDRKKTCSPAREDLEMGFFLSLLSLMSADFSSNKPLVPFPAWFPPPPPPPPPTITTTIVVAPTQNSYSLIFLIASQTKKENPSSKEHPPPPKKNLKKITCNVGLVLVLDQDVSLLKLQQLHQGKN
jgi:hypothetical protein